MFTDGCVQSIFLHSSGYSETDVDMTEKAKYNSDTESRMHQGRLYEPCQRPMKPRSIYQKSESDDGVTTRLSDPDQRSAKTSGRIPMLTSGKGKALHYLKKRGKYKNDTKLNNVHLSCLLLTLL